jgi:hypothetical protein
MSKDQNLIKLADKHDMSSGGATPKKQMTCPQIFICGVIGLVLIAQLDFSSNEVSISSNPSQLSRMR